MTFSDRCKISNDRKMAFFLARHKGDSIGVCPHRLLGPKEIPSMSGTGYILSIIDDNSRKLGVYLLKSRDEALEKFVEWRFLVEFQTGIKVNNVMTKYGLEFYSEAFSNLRRKNGIIKHKFVHGIQ